MTSRYLSVLGTASQAPTRDRSAGGYALHWDDQLILFDPGEGFQRQCLLAGIAIGRASAVCITHFHGDHCLGLSGIVHRRALSGCEEPLPVYFPESGSAYFERLVHSSIHDDEMAVPMPIATSGVVGSLGSSALLSEPLDHRVPTVGYRVQEPDRVGLDPELLRQHGLDGPAVGELLRAGSLRVGDQLVTTEELSERRPGQAMAFAMDTVICDGAVALAMGADLLLCEATYLDRDRSLARESKHLTARQAAWLAREAGVRRLVLSHFSNRYDRLEDFGDEAREIHDDVVVAADLAVIEVPPRHRHEPSIELTDSRWLR